MSKFVMKAGVHIKVLNKWTDISRTFPLNAQVSNPVHQTVFVVETTTFLNVFGHPTIHRH